MKETGTCIWFGTRGESYGYIGFGGKTDEVYNGQIYIHYKNISKDKLRKDGFREMKPGDILEYESAPGFHNEGTQAVNCKIIHFAEEL